MECIIMNCRFTPSKELLDRITKIYPTPFHLYSEAEIKSRAANLNKAFSWNKNYKEYYAVKACPTPGIIEILKDQNCGVDCASLCELILADRLGFRGDDIMFSSNETPGGEYSYAKKLGAVINLDDFSMIDFLEQECGLPDKICLRYNPGGELKLGNFVMGNPQDAKFGMTRDQIFEGAEKCLSRGVKKLGLHAFLASNTIDESYYPTNAAILMRLAADLIKTFGCEIFMINLSGGIGIPYRPEQEAPDIYRISDGVRREYESILAPVTKNDVCIASELGRYMTGPAGILVSKIIHKKHTHKEYLGLDSCAADLMRPAMYGAYHHITIPGKENAPLTDKYDVVGSLCENNDKFAVDRPLPKCEIGDYVIIHDTGAHGRSMGYNYNGRLRCAEVLLKEDGTFELIRRAETPEDYFATLDMTGYFSDIKNLT